MYHLLFSPPPPRPFSTLYFISLYFVYTVYFLHFISTLYVVQKPRKGRGERNRKEGERGGGERGGDLQLLKSYVHLTNYRAGKKKFFSEGGGIVGRSMASVEREV